MHQVSESRSCPQEGTETAGMGEEMGQSERGGGALRHPMSLPPCPWVYLGRLGKICQRFPESIEELMTASSSPATFSGKQLLDLSGAGEGSARVAAPHGGHSGSEVPGFVGRLAGCPGDRRFPAGAVLGAERCSLGSRLAESKGNFALAASASSAGSPLPGAPVPARLWRTRPPPRPCWKTLAFSAWAGVSEGGGGTLLRAGLLQVVARS